MNNKYNIELRKDIKTPLYIQLYQALSKMIKDNILKGDEKLPPVRKLCSHLSVNQITVVSAYKKLEDSGLIYKIQGSGCYVSNMPSFDFDNSHFIKAALTDELYRKEDLLYERKESEEGIINFSSTSPSPDTFPLENIKDVINEALNTCGASSFGYHEGLGNTALRESIAEFYKTMKIKSDRLLIVSGAQQGIDIISKSIINKGDFVLTESPTYSGGIAIFKARGANIIDMEMTNTGPVLHEIEKIIQQYKPKLLYTIPDFQNPTGNSWSTEKRRHIINLADKYGFYILEDGYLNELDYFCKNNPSLYEIDNNERVIYIKSFSGFFLSGFRLGYMLLPQSIKHQVMLTKHLTDISSSGFLQTVMGLFIEKGYWSEHLKTIKEIYRERYMKILDKLEPLKKYSLSYNSPDGGLNFWVKADKKIDLNEIIMKLSKENILIAPGSIFYSTKINLKNYFRLSFASTGIKDIENGFDKINGIFRKL
jgi:2-aminoadipate transaminase